ncbi:MAG: hypothetical protein J07HQX50_00803 [Haloquadratum sp. J07HQX50]|nr:MAG: hypothetical protein J07HQX50_00803 [Haloquadratum sp. J07HQX50]
MLIELFWNCNSSQKPPRYGGCDGSCHVWSDRLTRTQRVFRCNFYPISEGEMKFPHRTQCGLHREASGLVPEVVHFQDGREIDTYFPRRRSPEILGRVCSLPFPRVCNPRFDFPAFVSPRNALPL